MDIKIRLIRENAVMPIKASNGSSGFDLYSCEEVAIPPGCRRLIPLGFNIRLPFGYEAQIRPRSGLAAKHGLTVLNTPGTIDSDFDGDGPDFEVKVILYNSSPDTYTVKKGERVAQMVIAEVPYVTLVLDTELNTTRNQDRKGGFGSTG